MSSICTIYGVSLGNVNSEAHIALKNWGESNVTMTTSKEFRLYWLKEAIKIAGSAARLADLCDTSAACISQLKKGAPDSKTGKPRAIGDDLARRIEVKLEKPTGWMDRPPESQQLDGELNGLMSKTLFMAQNGQLSYKDIAHLKNVLHIVSETSATYDVQITKQNINSPIKKESTATP